MITLWLSSHPITALADQGDHGGSAKRFATAKVQVTKEANAYPASALAGQDSRDRGNEVVGHGYASHFSAISGIRLPADLKLQPDGHNIENLIMGGPEEKPYETFYYSNNSESVADPEYRAGRKYGNGHSPGRNAQRQSTGKTALSPD